MLSYWVAVECGLLNEQLRQDSRRVSAEGGFACADLDTMEFYAHDLRPEVEQAFHDYVKARWPIIAFAMAPVTDEQNIADASSVRRDLQLALAFAFSSGQVGFRQFLQYQRRIEQDSEAIALNRTVTTFVHGHETFGFRFYPRYQNPPQEHSNFSASSISSSREARAGITRSGTASWSQVSARAERSDDHAVVPPGCPDGRDRQLVPLHRPRRDEDPHRENARAGTQGGRRCVTHSAQRSIAERPTRKNDIERLITRVDQIEAMLPMQTRIIRVPYENQLGGFSLFHQGITSLVPQLLGFDGVDVLDGEDDVDILLYGKHFSVQETKVVVGGNLPVPGESRRRQTRLRREGGRRREREGRGTNLRSRPVRQDAGTERLGREG